MSLGEFTVVVYKWIPSTRGWRMSIFRKNSKLAERLGERGAEFVSFVAEAVQRILPHVETSGWIEEAYRASSVAYTTTKRTEIRITLSINEVPDVGKISLTTYVKRRTDGNVAKKTLDEREHDICKKILERINDIAGDIEAVSLHEISPETMQALQNSFDEAVVAKHLSSHFDLQLPVGQVFEALRRLSEQTYENKALVFGCLLGGPAGKGSSADFPSPLLDSKKYKALSDGFRTAYKIATDGSISDFVELDSLRVGDLTEKHYFPDWASSLARASLSGLCAIALTRQGDVLVFDRGSLRFSYRFGKWQYWNHKHVVALLREKARAQHVPVNVLGRVVGAIYRASLDISFRRSGGLFVIVHRQDAVREIVRSGDAIGDASRSNIDAGFDEVVRVHKMQSLPRAVAVELASLDGAVVIANSGQILAYGAVLQPNKKGRTRGTEGSRTKAAIGASNYGIAVKISSDGDISVYRNGEKFFSI